MLINCGIVYNLWVFFFNLIDIFIHSWVTEVLESQDGITLKRITGSSHYTDHSVTHSR